MREGKTPQQIDPPIAQILMSVDVVQEVCAGEGVKHRKRNKIVKAVEN